METTSYLLPDPGVSKCEQIEIEADLSLIRLKVTITQESAECPLCKQSSSRVHSDYWRTADTCPERSRRRETRRGGDKEK